MSAASRHLSCYSPYTGTSSLGWRFKPNVSTAGLERHLKLRSFVGFHPEDTLQCRATSWQTDGGVSVLLSPAPGMPAPVLARNFARLANLYYVELVARGWAPAGMPVRWLQHWPARAEAPTPHDEDRFEHVLLTPWERLTEGTPPPRVAITVSDALQGFAYEPTAAC